MLKFLQSELYIISVSILFLEMNYHVHGTEAGTEGTGGGGGEQDLSKGGEKGS